MTATGMMMAGTAGAAGDTVAPLVSADGTGFTNTRGIGGDCDVGLSFDTDGEEYRVLATGAISGTTQGTWLDQGTSDQVWIQFNRTGGSAGAWSGFSNSTRYQMNTTRTFRITDTTTGAEQETISGNFTFYDAASGGSTLDTTSTDTWIADYEEICPMCCFTPDTLITLASGIKAPIVSIRSGDMIAVQNGTEAVTEVITQVNRVMYGVKFADGRELRMSDDHPLYVYGKGYAAFNPVGDYKDLGMAKILKLGDKVLDEHGRLNKIVDVQLIDYPQTVYTFGNSKFYANGMLVY